MGHVWWASIFRPVSRFAFYRAEKAGRSRLMTWNCCSISVISRPEQQVTRVCLCVCVRGRVSAYFFPPYGCDLVICYSLLAHTHFWFSSTLRFSCLCGQSVLWLRQKLCVGCFVFFSCLRLVIMCISLLSILLQHPPSDWPFNLLSMGVSDVNTLRLLPEEAQRWKEDTAEADLKLGQLGVWRHVQAFVCLLMCFTGLFWRGRGWALARKAVVWPSLKVPNWHYWGKY